MGWKNNFHHERSARRSTDKKERLVNVSCRQLVPEKNGLFCIFLNENPADRKSTRLNSSHSSISYAVFCLKKMNKSNHTFRPRSISSVAACLYYLHTSS